MPSLSSITKKIDKVYGNGKLEKARIVIYTKSGDRYTINKGGNYPEKINVQFNPAEYSVQRRTHLGVMGRIGNDFRPEGLQFISGVPSVLSLNLYFDSYTELLSEQGAVNLATSKAADFIGGKLGQIDPASKYLPHFDMNEEYSPDPDLKVNQVCDTLLSLVKMDSEEHEPRIIGFVWGEHLHFVGKLCSYTVQYTAFNRDGTPVRAKIAMQILGEEAAYLLNGEQFPKESPDRTKQRTLHYGDQLWMMAEEEYGDVSHWKTIAQANGILNPRAINNVVRLKVPSIR